MAKTINDVYIELFKRFKESGSPAASLEARELTAFAVGGDKRKTADWGHVYLDDATAAHAHALCTRCLEGEPLAYLLGEWDFYGLTFKVTPSVLIPRSDTETLAQLAVERAKRLVNPRVLDLCCGSGCIGISVAHAIDDARVTAIDLSEDALGIARENARSNGVQSRFLAIHADVTRRPKARLGQFDIIVCNPPYITAEEMPMLEPSVRDFEPAMALYGGEDGLDFYRAITEKWSEVLVPGGLLAFECGYRQATEVAYILEENHLVGIGTEDDLSGIPRVVYGFTMPV